MKLLDSQSFRVDGVSGFRGWIQRPSVRGRRAVTCAALLVVLVSGCGSPSNPTPTSTPPRTVVPVPTNAPLTTPAASSTGTATVTVTGTPVVLGTPNSSATPVSSPTPISSRTINSTVNGFGLAVLASDDAAAESFMTAGLRGRVASTSVGHFLGLTTEVLGFKYNILSSSPTAGLVNLRFSLGRGHAFYDLQVTRLAAGWKIASISTPPL